MSAPIRKVVGEGAPDHCPLCGARALAHLRSGGYLLTTFIHWPDGRIEERAAMLPPGSFETEVAS